MIMSRAAEFEPHEGVSILKPGDLKPLLLDPNLFAGYRSQNG